MYQTQTSSIEIPTYSFKIFIGLLVVKLYHLEVTFKRHSRFLHTLYGKKIVQYGQPLNKWNLQVSPPLFATKLSSIII